MVWISTPQAYVLAPPFCISTSEKPLQELQQWHVPHTRAVQAAATLEEDHASTFVRLPAAPVLITPGPWREVDGSVCAPKGFRAQGRCLPAIHFLHKGGIIGRPADLFVPCCAGWASVYGTAPYVTGAAGFRQLGSAARPGLAGRHGGLRAATKKADIALIVADNDAASAGAFTTNRLCAAPVTFCRQVLDAKQTARAV